MSSSFTNSKLQTPVLLLIFKRLDTTKQVLEAIRQAQPTYLYIASDGPRQEYSGEAEKVQTVREYVINNIDWECHVNTLFREQNLGGPLAVTQALTWFFNQVNEGIILEDDCLPTPSFFRFCETMLERYRYDDRMLMVSGRNPFGEFTPDGAKNYFLANIGHTWGWATWKRAFQGFTLDLPSPEDNLFMSRLQKASRSIAEFENAKRNLVKMNSKNHPHWDFLWNIRQILEQKYAIFPCKNMIKNIGFSQEATHTKAGEDTLPVFEMQSDFSPEEVYDPEFTKRMIEKKHGKIQNTSTIPSWMKSWHKQIKALIRQIPLIKKIPNQQKFWLRYGHFIKQRRIHKWLQREHTKCLQVGGGIHIKSGQEWLNGDLIAGDIYLDATKQLPFPDNSLDVIFTEQFFEHLSQQDGLYFLSETYRVLKPGGILRQSTPDLEGLVAVYQDQNKFVSRSEAVARHIRNHRKNTPYAKSTGCQFINDVFRLWGHKFIYDQDTLKAITKEAGFQKFQWVNFGESENPFLTNLERHASVEWMKNAFVMIYEAEK
jgi:predicted SAM-dependent methyltransferase